MIIIDVINIVEICEDGSISELYDYNKLPKNVKDLVDEALNNDRTIECNIYKDSIQFLYSINHESLLKNKVLPIKYIGSVYFYSY